MLSSLAARIRSRSGSARNQRRIIAGSSLSEGNDMEGSALVSSASLFERRLLSMGSDPFSSCSHLKPRTIGTGRRWPWSSIPGSGFWSGQYLPEPASWCSTRCRRILNCQRSGGRVCNPRPMRGSADLLSNVGDVDRDQAVLVGLSDVEAAAWSNCHTLSTSATPQA
jgi:hypothetical protein